MSFELGSYCLFSGAGFIGTLLFNDKFHGEMLLFLKTPLEDIDYLEKNLSFYS